MNLDADDRHILAVAAVWAVVAIVLFLGGVILLGIGWRLFIVVAGLA